MKFAWKNWTGEIVPAIYHHDQSEAWRFLTEDGEPIATITVMLEDAGPPAPGYLFVKDWSENEGILAALVAHGYVEDTGKRVPTGWVHAAIVRKLVEPTNG